MAESVYIEWEGRSSLIRSGLSIPGKKKSQNMAAFQIASFIESALPLL